MGDLRDKNDRAIRAFLQPVVAAVGANIPIYITNDSDSRNIAAGPGLVDVETSQGAESPLGSGNYSLTTIIRAKMPSTIQVGPNSSDPSMARLDMSALIAAVHDALHQSDNGQDYAYTAAQITAAGNALATAPATEADNADMVNYSCVSLVHGNLMGGKPSTKEIDFVELITLTVNVVGFGGY